MYKIKYLLTLVIVLILTACGGGGGSSSSTDSSPKIVDSGFWGSAFSSKLYEKPYNAAGSIFYYKLSCRHNGIIDGLSSYTRESDTFILSKILSQVARYETRNPGIFEKIINTLDSGSRFVIVGRKGYLKILGDFEEEEGILVSNKNWKHKYKVYRYVSLNDYKEEEQTYYKYLDY